ncbi:MAG: UDP-N-acetylmuramate dehydrogenase [Candidatus Saganbacteria bacterium]|nr:UDP-N-acetylmuramate dehydrogenase [Candidatus Saganbacteria bacterium]
MKNLFDELCKQCKGEVLKNEPMARHTTFKVGGPADIMFSPEDAGSLKKALKILNSHKTSFIVIGKGSNLLVSDEGIRGVVIKLAGNMNGIKIKGTSVTAQAGVFMKTLIYKCSESGLSGLEPLIGIPAALGGAIAMNMSAWGTSISSLVRSVTVLTKEGKVKKIPKIACGFSYRGSDLDKGSQIIIEILLELKREDIQKISERQEEILFLKTASQPIGLPSAGCVFKNTTGEPSGKIIEKAGLKGERIGGAEVSNIHANYIVNTGGAKAADIKLLIERIRAIVMDKFGIKLELEIKTSGF